MSETEGTRDRKIEAVLFDLDNTLCDFVEAKIRSCRAVTDHLGREDDLLSYFFRGKYGIEDTNNIRDYLEERDLYDDKTLDECSRIYREVKLESVDPYDGIEDILRALSENGMILGVVTDAHMGDAVKRLNQLKLGAYIDILITYDMIGEKKVNGVPFEYALELLELPANRVAVVGDSLERDIKPAKDLGFYTIYAEYGDRNRPCGTKPIYDSIIHEPAELMDVLGSR